MMVFHEFYPPTALGKGGGKKRKKKTCPSLDVVAGSSEPMLEDTATKNVEEVV